MCWGSRGELSETAMEGLIQVETDWEEATMDGLDQIKSEPGEEHRWANKGETTYDNSFYNLYLQECQAMQISLSACERHNDKTIIITNYGLKIDSRCRCM